MKKIDEELMLFFDDMMSHIREFKRKKYAKVFEEGFLKYKDLCKEIKEAINEVEEEEKASLIEHFANVIPEYAYEQMQKKTKLQRDRIEIDYNLNMVVYIVPILNYEKDPDCEAVAKRMVELWNEKGVTSMQISYSDYDIISGGFKKKLCYITTAVCESRNLPDDCYELTTLRTYRDDYLMRTEEGQKLVEEYYDIAPVLVMCIDMQNNSKEIYENIYKKYLLPCLADIENDQMEACRENYVSMVHELERKYLYS